MDKIVSLAPLPAIIISELFKPYGIESIEVIDASGFAPDEIVEAVKGADYIIGDYTFQRPITAAVARAAKGVKLIQQPSVGYQHIDVAACREAGIMVANTAGANTVAVAEHTIMACLSLFKNIFFAARTTAAGQWRQMEVRPLELSGKTWGFVGFGRIGRAVAERLRAFGVPMLYTDPVRLDAAVEEQLNVTFAPLNDLLKRADVVSLHCPLTPQTAGLIGRENLALMKPTAILINVARGEVIDETALAEALSAGRLGGAALDVFAVEPIDPANPMLKAAGDKLLLSPHVAGVTQEAQGRIITMTIENIVAVIKGGNPVNLIN
ncbi:MAG: 2-hydroxyacid dehydrogenase [Syntrophaceae bacterium]